MPQTSRCISERAYSDGTSLARQMPVVTARFTWHRVCRAWQAHHVAAGRKFLTTTRTPVSSAVVTGASSRNSIIVNQMGSSPANHCQQMQDAMGNLAGTMQMRPASMSRSMTGVHAVHSIAMSPRSFECTTQARESAMLVIPCRHPIQFNKLPRRWLSDKSKPTNN